MAFDGHQYTVDALIEPFVESGRPDTSSYSDGGFGIIIPDDIWAMISEGQEGQGDFRLLKGQDGVCQTLDYDFVDSYIHNGTPALTIV